MKKTMRVIIPVLAVLLIAGLAFLFRDSILDALPIDQSRWEENNGKTYYYNEKGDLVTGWLDLDGNRYYMDNSGALVTGWLDLDGSRYYLGADGIQQTGWMELNGGKYYLDANGALVTGWAEVDDTLYYFDEDGALHTGWLTTEDGRYYLTSDGTLLNGWQEIDGVRYYLRENGSIATGWLELEGNCYYLGADGILHTGWLELDGNRYYLGEDGTRTIGWMELDDGRYYLDGDGIQRTGWTEIDGITYYLNADGSSAFGWVETEDGRRYLNADSSLYTGWLELDGSTYYLQEDGRPAVGKLVIDGQTHYFTSGGTSILLVNRWNTLSSDYAPENLVRAECGVEMVAEAAAALDAMVEACRAAGYYPKVRTAYRTYGHQQALLNNKVAEGYSYEEAIQIVAIPGTSEHQTGLAVDISDSTYTQLNAAQGNTAIQGWLHEHCWEYGFIVRYPDGTTDITGIICESWHYRYVGVELAREITELGLCLEEYLDMLTGDGTTCGDPESLS